MPEASELLRRQLDDTRLELHADKAAGERDAEKTARARDAERVARVAAEDELRRQHIEETRKGRNAEVRLRPPGPPPLLSALSTSSILLPK